MANTRAIVKRRKAIRNIRKITRTMELIATARFKKALDRAVEAEAYTRKIAELAADLSATATNVTHPLLQNAREVKRQRPARPLLQPRAVRRLQRRHPARGDGAHPPGCDAKASTLHLELSGKRAIVYFRFQGVPAEHTYTHFEDKPASTRSRSSPNRYIADYIAGRIDRVEVAYMKFLNAARQTPVVETLLPLSARSASRTAPSKEAGNQEAAKRPVEYEFLPGATDILEEILPVSFKVRLFKCFLDAAVSEQIARRVAMKAATENADDMIKALTRQYNRARQAQITKEIAEVIGGAEALK